MKNSTAYRENGAPRVLRLVAAGVLVPALMLGLLALFNTKAAAEMFTIVKCSSSSSACTGGNNAGSGPGVSAISKSGYGLKAATAGGPAAVIGSNPTSNSLDAAVAGEASNWAYGVVGNSLNNSGVFGDSTNGMGVEGLGTTGVYGQGGSIGLYGSTPSGGVSAVYALGASADGAQIFSDSGRGIFAQNGCGGGCVNNNPAFEAVSNAAGEGVDAFTSGQLAGRFENNGSSPQGDGLETYGQYIGLISRAPASGGYPYVATDLNNNDLFFIDGGGNVFYHGTLNNFLRTRDGNLAETFGATSTTPSIEDNGTARLTMGIAQIALNPAFARSIDGQRPYQVMLTPDGDTRGLYVVQKTLTSFTVREVQGGRSSIAFDYHVYATRLGYANQRMVEMTPSLVRAIEPRAQVAKVRPAIKQPIKLRVHK